jgi:outer membrane protein assembly factor BamD (BamD/ComL family)
MRAVLSSLVLLLVATAFASARSPAETPATDRGVFVYPGNIYIAPDGNSAKLTTADRGIETVVFEKSGEWAHVMASLTAEKDITGWAQEKYVVHASTPNGDRVVFGAAADAETEASRRHARRGAAEEAMRLYARMAEFWPQSPLAGEAAYRAADIAWQLEKSGAMTRPSAHEMKAEMREGMDEEAMRKVMKKYPGTKWADLAAYHLIDNKLCGDWKGESQCPEKETAIFEKYAQEHPGSPKAPEALYEAARRQAALIEIFPTENKNNKVAEARSRAMQLAQKITSQYSQTDWASRAETLIYMVQQNIPTYGSSF